MGFLLAVPPPPHKPLESARNQNHLVSKCFEPTIYSDCTLQCFLWSRGPAVITAERQATCEASCLLLKIARKERTFLW